MGTSVFPFKIQYLDGDPAEGFRLRRDLLDVKSGLTYVRGFGAPVFAARFTQVFTESGATSLAEFWRWVIEDLVNGTDSFLYEAFTPAAREAEDVLLGVSSGGAGERFSLPHRFINDATLSVTVDASTDANWTLDNNNVKPELVTGVGFAAGTVRASYRFRFQCILVTSALDAEQAIRGSSLASPGLSDIRAELREQKAGYYRA